MTEAKKLLTADVREMKYAGYGQHSQPVLRNGLLFADVYGKDQDDCENNVADVVQAINSHSELVKALEAAKDINPSELSRRIHAIHAKKNLPEPTPDEAIVFTLCHIQEISEAALTAAGRKPQPQAAYTPADVLCHAGDCQTRKGGACDCYTGLEAGYGPKKPI